MRSAQSSRREFLETAAAGAGLAVGAKALAEEKRAAAGAVKHRVGLVGVGGRGSAHLRLLRTFAETVEVVAVCDLVPERAERGVKLSGGAGKPYTDFKQMLKHDGLETVFIATPNYVHTGQAVPALDGGFFTFVEKPMACTIKDCNAIIEAVRRNRNNRNKGICQVGLQLRHHRQYRRVRELVSEGAIGDIKFVWSENFRGDWRRLYSDPEEERKRNWRFFQKLSGGSITEKNCHDLDIWGWIIGAPAVRVSGTGGVNVYTGRETLDHWSITVDYANACKLTMGTCLYARSRHDTVVIGSKGMLEFPRTGDYLVLRRKGAKDERIDLKAKGKDVTHHRGTAEMFRHFFDCIRSGKEPFCNPMVAKACIRVALAGELAVAEQRSVKLSEMPA